MTGLASLIPTFLSVFSLRVFTSRYAGLLSNPTQLHLLANSGRNITILVTSGTKGRCASKSSVMYLVCTRPLTMNHVESGRFAEGLALDERNEWILKSVDIASDALD